MQTVKFGDISIKDVSLVGGKGASLGEMLRADIPVPDGFVVTTEAFQSSRGKVSKELGEEIYRQYDALGAEYVAVRSSAVAEDSPTNSWAGQFESYLNVSRDELLNRIEDCWASLESGQIYADHTNTSADELLMAVVVQKMVDSEVAGVGFSINPVTKEPAQIMIEAIYGLGELLVQGMITPDNYVVSKENFEITDETVSNKPVMLKREDGESIEVKVPEGKANTPCLTEAKIEELAHLVSAIENHYGQPQDIEWALFKNKFMILQSRPITTL